MKKSLNNQNGEKKFTWNLTSVFLKTRSKFQNVFLSMDEATLPLWNEHKHNYVGPPVTEMNAVPVGLRRAWFSAVGLFLGRKIENFTYTKCFYFFILHTPAKFQASRFNNKRKSTSGGAIPLKTHAYFLCSNELILADSALDWYFILSRLISSNFWTKKYSNPQAIAFGFQPFTSLFTFPVDFIEI